MGVDWNDVADKRPGLLEIAKKHLDEAKKQAKEITDTDNPHGVTLVIHETTLKILFASAVVAGVEDQRDFTLEEWVARNKDVMIG
jgi:hypothetical protein